MNLLNKTEWIHSKAAGKTTHFIFFIIFPVYFQFRFQSSLTVTQQWFSMEFIYIGNQSFVCHFIWIDYDVSRKTDFHNKEWVERNPTNHQQKLKTRAWNAFSFFFSKYLHYKDERIFTQIIQFFFIKNTAHFPFKQKAWVDKNSSDIAWFVDTLLKMLSILFLSN